MSILFETTFGNLVVDIDAASNHEFLERCKKDSFFFTKLEANEDGVFCGQQATSFAKPGSTEVGLLVMIDNRSFAFALKSGLDGNVIGAVKEGFSVLETICTREKQTYLLHTYVLSDSDDKCKHLTPTQKQMDQYLKDANASFEAMALEIVGDVAHANVQPSPNTLFVARLNPITRESSLVAFFSTYGTVDCVRIFPGKKSLYAFVRYVQKSNTDHAYEKLHKGCIIDGHLIVVDFSQSVR